MCFYFFANFKIEIEISAMRHETKIEKVYGNEKVSKELLVSTYYRCVGAGIVKVTLDGTLHI